MADSIGSQCKYSTCQIGSKFESAGLIKMIMMWLIKKKWVIGLTVHDRTGGPTTYNYLHIAVELSLINNIS